MLMMQSFDYSFSVEASLDAVLGFHADTRALVKLNAPFVIVRLHRIDPMAEGSISEFTLWMGPIPICWRAVHSNVSSHGFTDTQEDGPMAFWQHTHTFEAIDDNMTRIHEQIIYEHPTGWRGLLTRVLFGRLGLMSLFTYRKWATRWSLR
jgi:ligand-binding SRPBCC domain-containing protein